LRFDRDYQLTIQTDLESAIVVTPPFNIAFNVDKSTELSLNKASIKVFGLSEANQLAIVKNANEQRNFEVDLQVGYAGSSETIFRGYIHIAERAREGAQIPLTMECIDGGFDARFSFTSRTVQGKSAIDAILEDMPNTQRGRITQLRELIRPRVLVGNSWQLVRENLNQGEEYFIDNGQLNILQPNEVISGLVPVVQASTGLLGSPSREEERVTFQTIMNPALKIGGMCDINSKFAQDLNGIYKNMTIGYDGEYEGSTWTQTVTCFLARDFIAI